MTISGHLELLERAEGFVLVSGTLKADPALLTAGPPLLHLQAADGSAEAWPLTRLQPGTAPRAPDKQPAEWLFQILVKCALPDGPLSVGLSLGPSRIALGPSPVSPSALRSRGALDTPDRQGLAGWVLGLPERRPRLLVDGRIALALLLDRPRPDLPIDTGEPEACLGFGFTLVALGDAIRAAEPGFTLLDGEPHSIALLAGDEELGHHVLRWRRTLSGKLERITEGQATGWVTEAEPLEPTPSVELLLDGTRWHTMPAAPARPTGVGSRLEGGAFRLELPSRSLTGADTVTVEIRPPHAREPLGSAAVLEGLAQWRPDHGMLLDQLPTTGLPQVSIVIPIHNAVEDVARCVASVLRNTTGRARLLLIDDASPDPGIAALFQQWEGKLGIELHRQVSNLGFTATCNRGFVLAGRDDVVLLNSDTEVGPGWLDGLRLAAHASPRVGTVTAVSNNAGAFSVPEMGVDNRLPPLFSASDMARLARQSALALWPSAPTGNGFCLYVRRTCLDAIGGFDEAAFPRGYGEENDFCMRAAAAGFEHRVDDRTWVWHKRSASFGSDKPAHVVSGQAVLAERYPEYRLLTGMFRDDPAFLALRWRMRRAVERALATGNRPRPRLLFVISTESGGTPQTNRDLMEALADRYEPWVLRCDSRVIVLNAHGVTEPEESWRLERPISAADHGSAEYDRYVAGLLVRHGFELVHIRHIAWHGIGLPRVCRALGIPVIFSFHDFYTLCPTIKLLDGEGHFCGGRCTQGPGECVAELWPASTMPPLRGRFVHRWRAAMSLALQACDAFVTTSSAARETLITGLPFLADRILRVIPHGRSFARLLTLASEPTEDEPLRVLVPGNISVAKGAALIAALAALDTGREIEFHVLGGVDSVLEQPRPGITLHGRYERERFVERVAAIGPHLAVILSTWPETYCHTLTECWSIGLPVIGTDIGAVGERIGKDGGGWLVDPTAEPDTILALLLRLKDDIAALRARREEVQRWQRRTGRHYDAAAMATAYDVLYRDVLQRRRSFAEAQPEPTPSIVLALGSAAEADGLRQAWPTDNDAGRGLIFRRISVGYPFGDPGAGPADIVLASDIATRPRDLVSVAKRCGEAGLPLCVTSDADPGGIATRAAQAAAGATFLVTSRLAASALRRNGYRTRMMPARLDPTPWMRPVVAVPNIPPRKAPCRLLGFADDPGIEMLRPSLENLRVLGVADYLLVGPGGLALGPDPVARIRAVALDCDLALYPLALATDEPRALALLACGLVLLRNRMPAEEPGERADGQMALSLEPEAWVRAIAELSVDAARRQAMARRSQRVAAAFMAREEQAALMDLALRGSAPTPPP